jgi:glycosyltransferase involved in cell wall biosynthesis
MNVLVLMLQSIRQQTNHGGSSKIVKDLVRYLATSAHDVTILCSRNDDNTAPFRLAPRVLVKPILPYRQSWQDTYLVPPFDLSQIIHLVLEHAEKSDHVLLFDCHFLFQDVIDPDLPLTCSLRDFVYVQALQGSFLFRRDRLIVPSNYIATCYEDAVASWLPGVRERIEVVPNGIDVGTYRPVDAADMRASLGLADDDFPVLLFPHRPEDAKGIHQALGAVRLLLDRGHDARLIVSRGTDTEIMPEVDEHYRHLADVVSSMSLDDAVIFTNWLPPESMPALYSASDVTLCLGDIIEAFSNVAIESLACGTPVVACDIAFYKELSGLRQLRKVAVGDLHDAVEAIADVMHPRAENLVAEDRAVLSERFNYASMLQRFRSLIENGTAHEPLKVDRAQGTIVRIPHWISTQAGGLYNEYSKRLVLDGRIRELWNRGRHEPFPYRDLGLSIREVRGLVAEGALVMVPIK